MKTEEWIAGTIVIKANDDGIIPKGRIGIVLARSDPRTLGHGLGAVVELDEPVEDQFIWGTSPDKWVILRSATNDRRVLRKLRRQQ